MNKHWTKKWIEEPQETKKESTTTPTDTNVRLDKITGEPVKPINTYLTSDLVEAVTGEPEKGEPEDGGFTTVVEGGESDEDAFVTIPAELIERMGWKDGDEISLAMTDNCFDWGSVPSIILRNLTKEK